MSKRPPIAFMSYARQDDMKLKGGITKFREHLSDAVELVTGEEFQIFQDRDDIKWGQNWKKRIQNSLDEVTFLIPIITPRFFKSEYCRDEVERFIGREKELKRDDLILPVYYVGCKQMDDESKGSSDTIAVKIKEHNWTDWRELRFDSFDSRIVQKNLDELAGQIMNALDRVAEDATQESDSDAEAVQENSRSESEKQDSKQKKTNIAPNERSTPTIDKTTSSHTKRIIEPLDKIIFLKPIMQITNRDISRIPPDGTRIQFRFRGRNYETLLNTVKYKYRTLNSIFTLKFKVSIDIWIHVKELYFNDEDGWHPLKILRG